MIECSQWLKVAVNFSWCFSHPWKSRFLNLDAANTLNQIKFLLCVCPVCCGIFSIIPGLYPLDASSIPPTETIKYPQTLPNGPWGQHCTPPRRTILIKFQKVRSLQTSAGRPDFRNSYRVFHSCFLSAAAIHINILICNFGNCLAEDEWVGKKAKISSCGIAVYWITCSRGAKKGGGWATE